MKILEQPALTGSSKKNVTHETTVPVVIVGDKAGKRTRSWTGKLTLGERVDGGGTAVEVVCSTCGFSVEGTGAIETLSSEN